MSATLHKLLMVGCVIVSTTSCSSARRGEPLSSRQLPENPGVQRGEKVFYEHCHQCHVGGEAALGPALNNKPLPGFLIRMQVRAGLGAMPSFPASHISDDELSDLVTYLKALRHAE